MDDEQPDHDNGSPTSGLVGWPLILVLGENDGDDDVAGCHTNSTDGKNGLTAKLVNIHDCWNRGEEHGNTNNTSRQE